MWKLLKSVLTLMVLVTAIPATGMAQASYKIHAGDVLQLEVLEDASLNRSLLVLPDGSITVPSGGTLTAAGFTVAQVQAAVTAALTPNFANPPTVYLAVGTLAPRVVATGGPVSAAVVAVYVLGEAAKPGRIDVPPGTTMLQFLAEAGGLSPFAATKRIQLRRTDATGHETVYVFNYNAIMAGAAAPVVILQKGDVIVIPQRRLFE